MANDLALMTTCALAVLGLVFNVFAVVAVVFDMDMDLAVIFGSLGIGLWMFAVAIFSNFLSGPSPRHQQRR